MTGKTHLAIGFAVGLYAAQYMNLDTTSMILFVATVTASSTLPDIDQNLPITHRGITHSVLPLAGLGYLHWQGVYPLWIMALFLGYASHLIADMLTPQGIQLLYPLPKRFRLLPKPLCITTGSITEIILLAAGVAYGLNLLT